MKVRISFGKGFLPLLFSSLMIFGFAGCAENNDVLSDGQNQQLEFSVTTQEWNNSNSSSDSDLKKKVVLLLLAETHLLLLIIST